MNPSKNLTAAFPGKYIQGENAMAELPVLIKKFGQNGLILASQTAKNKILPEYGISESTGCSCRHESYCCSAGSLSCCRYG